MMFLLLGSSPAFAGDPWTMPEGEATVFGGVVFETFDEFYRGEDKTDLPFGESDQYTYSIGGSYGITDDLTFDLAIGYVTVDGEAFEHDEEGLNDSTLALRYRVVDEFADDSGLPSLALRLGVIIPGSYDEGAFPISPGDGAAGVELSTLWGKMFGDTGLGTYGELGLRLREGSVPEDLYVYAGLFYTFLEAVTVSGEFRRDQALSGIDIGSANFTPDRSTELKEITNNIEFGLGYTCPGGYYFGVLYGNTVDGRNTGKKDIWGASFSIPL